MLATWPVQENLQRCKNKFMNRYTKLQILATLLDLRIEPIKGTPSWVRHGGPIIRELGPAKIGAMPGMSLKDAVLKSVSEVDLEVDCEWALMPAESPRWMLYGEFEAEFARQEKLDGNKMSDVIAGTDPRDAINIIMEQVRKIAQCIYDPFQVVIQLRRLAVLVIAAVEWSIPWIATVQKAPLDKSIAPSGGKIFAFPDPPKNPPEPPPLQIVTEKDKDKGNDEQ